ncbi:CaiB/BaiF CoA-transferase family protein [Conexibacter sp. S30A1]|uniref:CaiB/BaiF CoA transferase family protein n=1 Tax=Conexibacter sp. S30A1 TaxID=2937800 RepID=UPI0020107A29|nr:CoA transferase [Conexibacter sp. S30A1]
MAASQNGYPLEGVRVIDLTRALAGPFCTLILGGLGADVIKVEDPRGGDISRGNAPYIGPNGLTLAATSPEDISLAALTRLRGKRSVTLNLKHPEAKEVFADLVRNADVVVENFTSGTADRLGVGYEAASAANPQIVYCAISGFGADADPGVRAMDTIIQALSGTMLTSGGPEDPPIRVGVPIADVMTPVWAIVGILSALQHRQRTGVGEFVDVSMLGVVTSLVATEDWQALQDLGQPLRTGPTLPRLAPFGVYRCADGWFAMVAPQDRLVQGLVEVMGRPELLEDERFQTRDARVLHDAELTMEIESWAASLPAEEVAARLAAKGVPVAPIRTPIEAVSDPRVDARKETRPVQHPVLGDIPHLRTAGVPIRMRNAHVGFERLAPRLGEHTEEIFAGLLGYDEQRIQGLRDAGVI